jgi:ubiquinone/menaquinone biosynthesis C-methylase UbiE
MTTASEHEPALRERFLTSTNVAAGPAGEHEEFEREWRRIAPLLRTGTERALRVLDLGSGSGRWSVRWVEHGARVTGADFDLELLALSYTRPGLERNGGAHDPFQGVVADATRLPLQDRTFDVVTLNSLLEHIPDWKAAVSEGARVLAPKGVLIVHTSNRWHPFQGEINHFPFYPWLPKAVKERVLAWIMEHRRDLVNYTEFPAVNWFSYPELKGELARHGLEPFDRLDLTPAKALTGVKALGRFMVRDGERAPMARPLYYALAKTVSLYARRPETDR